MTMVDHWRMRALGIGAAAAVLAGCGKSEPIDPALTPAPSHSASTTGAPAGNGSLYVSDSASSGLGRFVIDSDGELSEQVTPISTRKPEGTAAVLDGVDGTLILGDFTDFWTANIDVFDSITGVMRHTVKASKWCGASGPSFASCVLLDETKLARTNLLENDGSSAGEITITNLADGSEIAKWGPFQGLSNLFATNDPEILLLMTSPNDEVDQPTAAGKVWQLNVTTGSLVAVGARPAGWQPICPLGTDSLLGFVGGKTASVVGPAKVGKVSIDSAETPLGCSADGHFAYLQMLPRAPGEGTDNEAANPPTKLTRINLNSGKSETLLTLDPGKVFQAITR